MTNFPSKLNVETWICSFAGLVGSIQNEPEANVPVTMEVDRIRSVEMDTLEPTESNVPVPMEVEAIRSVDTFEPIPMDLDESHEPIRENEPPVVQLSVQGINANNLLRTRPIGARRLSDSMPRPMPTIKEENENESDKENRQPEEEK